MSKKNKSYEERLSRSRFKGWYEFVKPRSKLSFIALARIWLTPLSDDYEDDDLDPIDSAEAVRPRGRGRGA
jgi:hypothetical protein